MHHPTGARRAATASGDNDPVIPKLPNPRKPKHLSQADEGLRQARSADARTLPAESRSRRRMLAVRGW